ncbi:MAG: methionyl-tRNA formyltransferase [Treponema sp.]|nr:methionyl-tRNA formyltransferase [Treponema sp.]
MRILFAGSPAIAVPSLTALSAMDGSSVQVAGVLTNPDTLHGRKGGAVPTEISAAASILSAEQQARGSQPIVQLKFDRIGAQARNQIAALNCDLLVCFAYGRIFGPKCLSLFKLGAINVHPSLLPRYRGPAPIQAAILGRDKETGVTIQRIAAEMDTGEILAQEKIPLNGRETAASLSLIAADLAGRMLPLVINDLMNGTLKPRPQTGEVINSFIISREQGRIDWNLAAAEIDARVRAFNPWPFCYTRFGGEDLYILEGSVIEYAYTGQPAGTVLGIDRNYGILIQTGDGTFAVSVLQRQAKKALAWKLFLNGARDFLGARLE